MDDHFIQSREALLYARDALRRGDMTGAREWAERAAQLAPQNEDPWLILAAVASPRESVDYIRKALQANPDSPRAKKGMEWAMHRLGESPSREKRPGDTQQTRVPASSENQKKPGRRSPLFPILLVLMGCVVVGFAAWSAVTSPVLASILSLSSAPLAAPTHAQVYASVDIAKPASAAVATNENAVVSVLPTNTQFVAPTIPPTDLPALVPTEAPTNIPEPTQTSTPEATATPGTMYAEIVPDTPTPEYVPPTAAPNAPASPQYASNGGEHWIDVDLSQQRVYAYEGDTIVNSFIVSTGTWQTPTVTGKFRVWIKLRSTTMAGPGYYLTNVPYTMYFYKGYGLHGTYWHNNFGTPMSHGCVNLTIPDAEWLYNFSVVGTVVNVHY
jgi:lipoprotein-anchoring transpeptidase ErfK/SrfK